MPDEKKVREIVNRFIDLKNVEGSDGRTRNVLHLTNGHGDVILMAGPTASLRARRDQLEHTLMTMVAAVLYCDRCETTECVQRDDGLCTVIQVMES